ncbi:MAG: FAD-binding oxidoreductase [Chloroflexi bacterium]|nr:FAD-binding oxidoreductase [Chloroflexota bacterium]OJV99312.1 MAG: D-amino-acid oxidase [Chloroflexi bacterium 54-19]
MKREFDVLVIGAGIVGTACTLELAKTGLTVAVLEGDTVGSGATAAGMGHIVVMDDSPAQLALTRYSQLLWDELVQSDPRPHEYHPCGTLWLAADAEEMAGVELKQELYLSHGIPCQPIGREELYRMEPNVRPGLEGGFLVPGDSVVYPPSSAAYLLSKAKNFDTTFIRGQVTELVPGGVRLADGATLKAENVVVAGGWNSKKLLPELPMRAKKGHLVITDRYPDFVKHQLVEMAYIKNAHASEGDSVAFNVQPRPTGQVLIGSSRQYDREDASIDFAILGVMLRQAFGYMPGLAELSTIRVWTGIRPATPDGLPLIGPYPAQAGVWLATGHEGLGITTALGTARLLAAQLTGQPAEIATEPYLPARFSEELAHV